MSNPNQRISIFTKKRAEVEAKKAKQDEETASALKDFVKSFGGDSDGEDTNSNYHSRGNDGAQKPHSNSRTSSIPARPSLGGAKVSLAGPSKRHFTSLNMRPGMMSSGPGTLGSGSRGGSSLRKRPAEGPHVSRLEAASRLGFGQDDDDDSTGEEHSTKGVLAGSVHPGVHHRLLDDGEDDDPMEEAAAITPKPTIRLQNIPLGMSITAIKAILPASFRVEGVRFELPLPSDQPRTERRCTTVIVTLHHDTPASEMDAAVSSLQGRYLGWGLFLSISRHLSTSIHVSTYSGLGMQNIPLISTLPGSLPFGAKPIQARHHETYNRAAPPVSLTGRGYLRNHGYSATSAAQPTTQVHVVVPTDIRQLRMIHQTVEALLTHGPEFEALLMTRPEVQKDERWAWIWDSRSPAGVYYRWRIWSSMEGPAPAVASSSRRRGGGTGGGGVNSVFEGKSVWIAPTQVPLFEYVTSADDIVDHDDYPSSGNERNDSEDRDDRSFSGDDDNRRDEDASRHRGGGAGAGRGSALDVQLEPIYLNPMNKSRLVYLLARLPTKPIHLRKGDVARVTGFCIAFSRIGADEVVDMVISNIESPFCFTTAKWNGDDNDDYGDDNGWPKVGDGEGGVGDPTRNRFSKSETPNITVVPSTGTSISTTVTSGPAEDRSAAHLIGLFVLSDILSASSTSGVPGAWKYRAAFEASLRSRQVFHSLGQFDKRFGWGKLKAERWRRSVENLFHLWEGLSAFSVEGHREMVDAFLGRKDKDGGEDAGEKKTEESGEGSNIVAKNTVITSTATATALAPATMTATTESKWKTVTSEAAPISRPFSFVTIGSVPGPAANEPTTTTTTTTALPLPSSNTTSKSTELAHEDDLDGEPLQSDSDGVGDSIDLHGEGVREYTYDSDENLDGEPLIDSSDIDMDDDGDGGESRCVDTLDSTADHKSSEVQPNASSETTMVQDIISREGEEANALIVGSTGTPTASTTPARNLPPEASTTMGTLLGDEASVSGTTTGPGTPKTGTARRQRPRAADMIED